MKHSPITIIKPLKGEFQELDKPEKVEDLKRRLRSLGDLVLRDCQHQKPATSNADKLCRDLRAQEDLHFMAVSLFKLDTDGTPLWYLLVELNVDGPTGAFISALCRKKQAVVEFIFQDCEGFPENPDSTKLARYLESGCQKVGIFHVGNTARRVERIRNELEVFKWTSDKVGELTAASDTSNRLGLWEKLLEELSGDKKIEKAYVEAVKKFKKQPWWVRNNLFYSDTRASVGGTFGKILRYLSRLLGLFALLHLYRAPNVEWLVFVVGIPSILAVLMICLSPPMLPKHLRLGARLRTLSDTITVVLKDNLILMCNLGFIYFLYLIITWIGLGTLVFFILSLALLLITIILLGASSFVADGIRGLYILAVFSIAVLLIGNYTEFILPGLLVTWLAAMLIIPMFALIPRIGFYLSAAILSSGSLGLLPHLLKVSAWELTVVEIISYTIPLYVSAILLILLSAYRFFWKLRKEESGEQIADSDILPEKLPAKVGRNEDFQFQNHFASVTHIKDGAFRVRTLNSVLRTIYRIAVPVENQGFLGTVATIHFGRFLTFKNSLIFLGNYDGSWGSYLADFHSMSGLSAIWSQTHLKGIAGFPRTVALIKNGGRFERQFKRYARNSQIESLIWYSAYPGARVLEIRRATATCEFLHRLLNKKKMFKAKDSKLIELEMEKALLRLS